MDKNPIQDELKAAQSDVWRLRGEVAQAEKSLAIAQARLEAFEIAAKAFEDAAPKGAKGSVKRKRNRLPNADWQKVFQTLFAHYENEFGYDEVIQATLLCGIDGVKRPSLRTKMMNYADGGYVERRDAGRFSITPKGIPYFKIEVHASEENEPRSEFAGGSDAGQKEVRTFPRPWN